MKKDASATLPAASFPVSELSPSDDALRLAALDAARGAYAPYSRFRVGAALRMADGSILTGSNQENAAYPSGICAERTALFAAGATHPGLAVDALLLVALSPDGAPVPCISPCGACRQVMMETQTRQKSPLRVLLCGASAVLEFPSVNPLLPFWSPPL